jgi:hypothetical protein
MITYVHAYTPDGTRTVIGKRSDRKIKEGDAIPVTLPAEKMFVFNGAGNHIR